MAITFQTSEKTAFESESFKQMVFSAQHIGEQIRELVNQNQVPWTDQHITISFCLQMTKQVTIILPMVDVTTNTFING